MTPYRASKLAVVLSSGVARSHCRSVNERGEESRVSRYSKRRACGGAGGARRMQFVYPSVGAPLVQSDCAGLSCCITVQSKRSRYDAQLSSLLGLSSGGRDVLPSPGSAVRIRRKGAGKAREQK